TPQSARRCRRARGGKLSDWRRPPPASSRVPKVRLLSRAHRRRDEGRRINHCGLRIVDCGIWVTQSAISNPQSAIFMLKIAVDAMGGDYAPASEVEGAIEAARDLGDGVIRVGS